MVLLYKLILNKNYDIKIKYFSLEYVCKKHISQITFVNFKIFYVLINEKDI